MNNFLIGFIGGGVAFVHCLGMCGTFALHLSQQGTPAQVLGRQLAWHASKTLTYTFLGALAGFSGGWIQSSASILWAQDILSILSGIVMGLMGLVLAGVPLALGRRRISRDSEGLSASFLRHFFVAPSAGGAMALGLATGLLPCPIVVAYLAYSAHTGSVAAGMTMMAGMGIGTAWSLILLGLTGHMLTIRLRRWASVTAGVILIMLGLTTALRATPVFHRLLGCQSGQEACSITVDGTGAESDSCCGHEEPAVPRPER